MRHTIEILLLEGASVEGLTAVLAGAGLEVIAARELPCSPEAWNKALEAFLAGKSACLVTVGGVVPPGDFLPDLMGPLIARPVPGIPEAIRSLPEASPMESALFRGLAGLTSRERFLVNLPERKPWLASAAALLARVLPHALDKAAGDQADCGPAGGPR